jgi:hypothetical protein|nr:MAG TPA: hypothetical protein [Caudoviricetes sp.]
MGGGTEVSASNVIPAARVSPRIANGCICWYEGDTFSLRLRLELEDQDGAAVTVGASDSVKITFYDRMRAQVQQFVFSGIVGNTVTLDFTEDVSAKFRKGLYRYDILYTHGDKTTLASGNVARVE